MTLVSDLDDLKGKMKLILSQVTSSTVGYELRQTRLAIGALAAAQSSRPPEILIADPGDAEMINEQILLLKTLYVQCTPELQTSFSSILLGEMTDLNAAVIVHTVVELAHLAELRKLLDDPKKLNLNVRRHLWEAILQKLIMESHRFTDDDLNQLDDVRTAEIKHTTPLAKRPRPEPVI